MSENETTAESTEAKQPTMQDRVAEFGLSMTAEQVPENPNQSKPKKDEKPWEAVHFLVKLTAPNGRTLTTYYSMGIGLLDRHIIDNWKPGYADGGFISLKDFKVASSYYARRTLHNERIVKEVRARGLKTFKPEIEDVLNCLAMDASSVENARDFEDFANELGYDSDSRSAEKTYRICQEQARELESLLGRTNYQVLLFETETL